MPIRLFRRQKWSWPILALAVTGCSSTPSPVAAGCTADGLNINQGVCRPAGPGCTDEPPLTPYTCPAALLDDAPKDCKCCFDYPVSSGVVCCCPHP